MEYLQDSHFKFQSLLLSLNQNEIMPAVITILGEGSVASIAAVVFYNILESYTHFLSHQSKLAEKYDGYMVKTVSDINIDTLISVKQIRNSLDKLKEYGLIDIKTGGNNNHTTIKVNVECVDLIEKAYEKFKTERDKKIEDKKDKCIKQSKIKENNRTKMKYDIDFDKLNSNPVNIDNVREVFSVVDDEREREASIWLVLLWSQYFYEYTLETYTWNKVKYCTLMTMWREEYGKPNDEICLTLNLKRQLNRTNLGMEENVPLEKRVVSHYNHDYKLIHCSDLYYSLKSYEDGYGFDCFVFRNYCNKSFNNN